MKDTGALQDRRCVPCQGGVPPLGPQAVAELLDQLKGGWIVNERGHLYKRYGFHDFRGAIGFANEIAIIAEREGHHPDLTLSWGLCAVEVWTHKIKGLSESDFILAAKIEAIPAAPATGQP